MHHLSSSNKNSLCSYHIILCSSNTCFNTHFIALKVFLTGNMTCCKSCYNGLSLLFRYSFFTLNFQNFIQRIWNLLLKLQLSCYSKWQLQRMLHQLQNSYSWKTSYLSEHWLARQRCCGKFWRWGFMAVVNHCQNLTMLVVY